MCLIFRGVELRSDKNPYLYMQSEVYDPRRNVLNISYPINGKLLKLLFTSMKL